MKFPYRVAMTGCVLAGCIGTYIWYQTLNTALKAEYGEVSYGAKLTSVGEKLESQSNRRKVLNKAKLLRRKWEPWAREHRVILKGMMETRPVTLQTFTILEQALPRPGYSPDGIQWADLMPKDNSPAVMRSRGSLGFTWQVPPERPAIKEREANSEFSQLSEEERNANWEFSHLSKRNDYPLMVAMGGAAEGRETLIIWASGLITEEVLQKNKKQVKGGRVYMDEPRVTEIESCYDFLKGK